MAEAVATGLLGLTFGPEMLSAWLDVGKQVDPRFRF